MTTSTKEVQAECKALSAVGTLLDFIGEDKHRDGLAETPLRVINSFKELYGGYQRTEADLAKLMKTFDVKSDEMVAVRDIEFYSTCEHHMLPFFGKAHIAYIPDGRVIGLSKIARVLEHFARRLQVQERLTTDVTNALNTYLKPRGVACVIEATHFCMVARGVGKQNSRMTTSSLLGAFKEDPSTRAEFLSMVVNR